MGEVTDRRAGAGEVLRLRDPRAELHDAEAIVERLTVLVTDGTFWVGVAEADEVRADLRCQRSFGQELAGADLGPQTFRPMRTWLNGQTSPEMLYLETKWASLIPFARAADLLKEVLPVGDLVSAETRRSSRSVELSKVKYSSLNRAVTTQPKRLAQGVVDVGLPSSRIVCRFKCTEPD